MEQTMAEHKYHQATLQHLAHLQQDSAHQHQAQVLHQHQVGEQLLQRQQQAALVAVQALEHQRLERSHQAEDLEQMRLTQSAQQHQ
jgi:hypothetical protein